MNNLLRLHQKKIRETEFNFKRYLFDEINWDRRLIGIKGARGVGKTTLVLQYIKENFGDSDEALYVSLDNIYFAKSTLIDFAEEFIINGGKYLFLDEIHKYKNWSQELKNIYDNFSKLKVVFTGSSILEIDKGDFDLSRRAMIYNLQELSLREYLNIEYSKNYSSFSLDELISNYKDLSHEISNDILIIKEYKKYNENKAYPFYKEAGSDFSIHLERIINLILNGDLPTFVNIEYGAIQKIRKLLLIIAESVPFKPNITKLSEKIGIKRDTLLKYLEYLEKASLISMVWSSTRGMSKLNKPDKIYLQNSNLLYTLNFEMINTGTVRETFFRNQLSKGHKIEIPKKGDFLIDEKYTFEIGGKNKTQKQILDIENSFLALDDINIGVQKSIPLWLFGFLY